MVTWVRFCDRQTGSSFYFANTHLDHQSQKSRQKSAELIVERSLGLDAEIPLLLVGDFNADDTTSSVYQMFIKSGFTDTWTDAKQRGPLLPTYHGYGDDVAHQKRIDWILARGRVSTSSTWVVDYSRGKQYPSDHFPVLALVRLGNISD